MSFARETKASLCALSLTLKHDCCRRAQLYGILYGAGVFTRERCKLVTTSSELSELTLKWLCDQHSIEGNLYVSEKKTAEEDEKKSYKITIPQKKELERLFHNFRYENDESAYTLKSEMLRCPNCQGAFVRGVFMSSGTVTDPDKSYHLEMSLTSDEIEKNLYELLCSLGLEPKRTIRKTERVLYYKDSESIENFLAFIGANNAAFTIMNKKIERELRSDANRIANSELANLSKTVSAAGSQIAAIKKLTVSGELSKLPDELRITAKLRLENPDVTLSQLAELHTPPITKSGVNHRLKKLLELGQQK